MSDMTNAVFYTFLVLFVLLFILNAPMLESQKEYFLWGWGMMFLYYPIVVLKHING